VTAVTEDRAAEIDLLRSSVRDSLAALFPGLPGDDWATSWTGCWDTLSEQGLWSTITPPEGSVALAVVVAEELGRALYPGPGCDALAAAFVGDGALLVAADSVGVRVPETGTLLIAGDEGVVRVCAGDVAAEPADGLDVTRDLVRWPAPQGEPVASAEVAADARAVRALLHCADTLGCVERVLAKTVDYALQRTTFGAPIGRYQAVAHRLVDHEVTARQMRLILDAAVAAVDTRAQDRAERVLLAQTFFFGRGRAIISDCIQLCGGIGFTWEWGHHFFLRRVVANDTIACGPGRPQQRLAQEASW
jgi:alkylation response protein AidB-like acyl-CoA dehydrogenase